MFQCKNLRDPSAHGVAANNRLVELQIVEYRRSVVGKHLDRIFRRRLAGLSHSTIVESDDGVIAGKLGHLVDVPNFSVACRFAEKEERGSTAIDLIVDVCIFELQHRHDKPPRCPVVPHAQLLLNGRHKTLAKEMISQRPETIERLKKVLGK